MKIFTEILRFSFILRTFITFLSKKNFYFDFNFHIFCSFTVEDPDLSQPILALLQRKGRTVKDIESWTLSSIILTFTKSVSYSVYKKLGVDQKLTTFLDTKPLLVQLKKCYPMAATLMPYWSIRTLIENIKNSALSYTNYVVTHEFVTTFEVSNDAVYKALNVSLFEVYYRSFLLDICPRLSLAVKTLLHSHIVPRIAKALQSSNESIASALNLDTLSNLWTDFVLKKYDPWSYQYSSDLKHILDKIQDAYFNIPIFKNVTISKLGQKLGMGTPEVLNLTILDMAGKIADFSPKSIAEAYVKVDSSRKEAKVPALFFPLKTASKILGVPEVTLVEDTLQAVFKLLIKEITEIESFLLLPLIDATFRRGIDYQKLGRMTVASVGVTLSNTSLDTLGTLYNQSSETMTGMTSLSFDSVRTALNITDMYKFYHHSLLGLIEAYLNLPLSFWSKSNLEADYKIGIRMMSRKTLHEIQSIYRVTLSSMTFIHFVSTYQGKNALVDYDLYTQDRVVTLTTVNFHQAMLMFGIGDKFFNLTLYQFAHHSYFERILPTTTPIYPTASTPRVPMATLLPLRRILESVSFNITEAFNMTITQILQLVNVSRNEYFRLTSSFGIPYNVQSIVDEEKLKQISQRLFIVKERILDLSTYNITLMLMAVVPTQGNYFLQIFASLIVIDLMFGKCLRKIFIFV